MHRIGLIQQAIADLRTDFIGFNFSAEGFSAKVTQFILVAVLFYLMYCVGRVIERKLFKGSYNKNLEVFVRFGLGYIVIGTAIFLLGFFSLLTPINIIVLLLGFALVAHLETKNSGVVIRLKDFGKPNAYKLLCICLVVIYFLRLIPPAAAGDSLDYHVTFPRTYLYNHSMMIPPMGNESYSTVPHLPEMFYIPSEVFSHGEMSRVIHFGFFVLILVLLFRVNVVNSKLKDVGPISALLFAISPLVLHISTSAFSDFPAVLCLIVSGYILLNKKLTSKAILLSGILIGGALASKIWVLCFFPFYLLYFVLIVRGEGMQKMIKKTTSYLLASLLVPAMWYLRSFLLTGNPLYINENLGRNDANVSLIKYFQNGLNSNYLNYRFHLNADYGFLYLIGLIFALIFIKKFYKTIDKKYFTLIVVLFIASLILPISFVAGRYAFPYLLPVYTIAATGFALVPKKFNIKIGILLIVAVMFLYYTFNTFIILPYGFGWAKSENYIKRNLIKDVASYYDYNGKFSKNISKSETIITFGMSEFYYADFRYKNLYYFFDQKQKLLNIPPAIKKLLVRGGDFNWICKKVGILNCNDYQVKIITSDAVANQVLYNISRKNGK